MSAPLWLAVALAGVIVGSLAMTRIPAAGAPRLSAVVELLGLVSVALLPPVLLVCVATAVCGPAPARCQEVLCLGAAGASAARPVAQLVLYALAAALVARMVLFAVRALVSTHRATLHGQALVGAALRVAPGGGSVWVIPSAQPTAFSGGWWKPKAVVSSGLLDMLSPTEQEAVLRHEVAHVRLGHPRLLVLATALAHAYGFLPPARAGVRRLRRSFEAAADDEVVSTMGAQPLLRALAKTAIALSAAPATAGFADACDLRYRIRRLQHPAATSVLVTWVLGVSGLVLTTALAWSACVAVHHSALVPSILPCLAGFAWLGWRPIWRARRQPPPAEVVRA